MKANEFKLALPCCALLCAIVVAATFIFGGYGLIISATLIIGFLVATTNEPNEPNEPNESNESL